MKTGRFTQMIFAGFLLAGLAVTAAFSQTVDIAVDSRYNETQDIYQGVYPGIGYDVHIESTLFISGGPLQPNRISWAISSLGYFNIPADLPETFEADGVTWQKVYYYYDEDDGPDSEVRYQNVTIVPADYVGTFTFSAKTARETPNNTSFLDAWYTYGSPLEEAVDNQNGNNYFYVPITVGSSPLPVKLSTFSVTAENTTSQLSWTTTAESNSSHFEIEHSADAKHWRQIGQVKSNGTTSSLQRYRFGHENPSAGMNYYRLRMVDLDGSFEFSNVESLRFGFMSKTEIYPNPVSDILNIRAENWEQVTGVTLYNSMGVAAYRSPARPEKEIKLSHLPSGMYLLRVTRADFSSETRTVMIGR